MTKPERMEKIQKQRNGAFITFIIALMMLFGSFEGRAGSQKEARAVWITRYTYTASSTVEGQKTKIRTIMKKLADYNCNVAIFQVRGQGDAFYKSELVPWSSLLSGRLGQDPGWDPLQYAIVYAKRYGIKLHAWINVYPCWPRRLSAPPSSDPQHVYNAHPEWLCAYADGTPMSLDGSDGYVALSPGNPEVREHILRVAMEIGAKYDIDGLHMDYIRYPDNAAYYGFSHDPISIERYNSSESNPQNLSWASWQREQINLQVRELHDSLMTVKPWLYFSAAVLGKYSQGSTGSTWNGYDQNFQDASAWTLEGKIDYIAPMLYGAYTYQNNPKYRSFKKLLYDWMNKYSHQRHVYAGIGNYLLNDNFGEVAAQIYEARIQRAQGVALYEYSNLDNAGFWNRLKEGPFATKANIPALGWKDDIPPNQPQNLVANRLADNAIRITWQAPDPAVDSETAAYYNIFRAEENLPTDPDNPVFLYAITGDDETNFLDRNVSSEGKYFYWVSALDRVNNEGPSTSVVTTGVRSRLNEGLPGEFTLYNNYPNPFNAGTVIRFEVPQGQKRLVVVTIYNPLGQQVAKLAEKKYPSGIHYLHWPGTDDAGNLLGSGTYFLRVKAGETELSQKLSLLR